MSQYFLGHRYTNEILLYETQTRKSDLQVLSTRDSTQGKGRSCVVRFEDPRNTMCWKSGGDIKVDGIFTLR